MPTIKILKAAQTDAEITEFAPITILNYLQAQYSLTSPDKTNDIIWTTNFHVDKQHGVIIKHLRTLTPNETIGTGRIENQALFKCHIYATGINRDAAYATLDTLTKEIKRIIKTDINGLNSAGYDEIDLDSFEDRETGDESKLNNHLAGDENTVVRDIITISLRWEEYQDTKTIP